MPPTSHQLKDRLSLNCTQADMRDARFQGHRPGRSAHIARASHFPVDRSGWVTTARVRQTCTITPSDYSSCYLTITVCTSATANREVVEVCRLLKVPLLPSEPLQVTFQVIV